MKSDRIGLSDVFRKYGYLYVILDKTDSAAIYKQLDPDNGHSIAGYEVFKIKIQWERNFQGRYFPRKERFTSDEDFGKIAWTYPAYELAYPKYLDLNNCRW